MRGTKRQRLETCYQSDQAFSLWSCGDMQEQRPLASILETGEKTLHPSADHSVTVSKMFLGKLSEPDLQEPLKPPQRSLVVSPEQYPNYANNTSQLICSAASLESCLWMTE